MGVLACSMILLSIIAGARGRVEVVIAGIILISITIKKSSRSRPVIAIIGLLYIVRALIYVNYIPLEIGDFVKVETKGSLVEKIENKFIKNRIYLEKRLEGEKYYSGYGEIRGLDREGGVTIMTLKGDIKKEPTGVLKEYLSKKVDTMLSGRERGFRGFYRGVILGEKTGIDKEEKEFFSATGTSHLIVISGLHIGIIISLVLLIVGMLPVPRDIRYYIAITTLSIYIAAIGYTPSVVRAYVMGMCILVGKLFYEEADIEKSFLISLIVNLIIDPLGANKVAFQMSYVAVYTIIWIYPLVKFQGNSKLLELLSLSFIIQLMLTPIFMRYFNVVPIGSFIVNVVAIPLGSVLIILCFIGLLTGIIGLGWLVIPSCYLLYILLIKVVEVTSRLKWLNIEYRGDLNTSGMMLIYLLLFGILYRVRGKTLRTWRQ